MVTERHNTPQPISADLALAVAEHERECRDGKISGIYRRIAALEMWRAGMVATISLLGALAIYVVTAMPSIVQSAVRSALIQEKAIIQSAVRDVLIQEKVLIIQPGHASLDFSLVPSASASTLPVKGAP